MTDKTPGTDQVVTHLPTARNAVQGPLPEEAAGRAWFRRFWPLATSGILSLLWIGACIWWFVDSGKTLDRMPLYEISGLLAGASLPLILVWLVALVYLRTDPLRDHRAALAHGLDGLLAPLDMAQRRVNSIVAELHKEIKHVEAAGDIASTRLDNLEKRFQGQISDLFEVTTDAEAKAATLQTTLSSEREAFSGLVAEVTEHITELETLFKQMKFDSESIANTARKNSEKVSNEITFQNKTLEERSRLMEERLERIGANLNNLSDELTGNCQSAEDSLNNITTSLSEKQAALTEGLARLAEDTDRICAKMETQSRTIADLNKTTAEDSDRITATITAQAGALSQVAADALSQTRESGDAFQAQADEMNRKLLSATEDLQVKSESLEHTISARVNAMEETFEKQARRIQQTAGDTSDKLEITLSAIEQQAARVDAAVKLTTESLDENTGLMSGHYQSFEQMTDKFRAQVTLSEQQLKSQHDHLVESISDVANHLEDALQKLKDESGALGEHAQEIITGIVGQTEHLSERIDDIRDRTENTIRNIQDMEQTVSSHFTATDEQAANLSENWIKTARLLENQCSDTLSRLDGLSEKLAALEKENFAAAKTAEGNVSKIADQMQIASESIHLAAASASEAADETNHLIDKHADRFQQLINALQLSNKSILSDAEAIEKKLREKSGSHFSNLASKIIEQLQSLSIDINRYIDDDVPDDLWQAYVNGDKNAFIRRLKKLTSKKQASAIREKYKTDAEFRKYALEYLQLFEDLMSQSMASDTYSIFSVALISSETGKVYLALAQAVDRFS